METSPKRRRTRALVDSGMLSRAVGETRRTAPSRRRGDRGDKASARCEGAHKGRFMSVPPISSNLLRVHLFR